MPGSLGDDFALIIFLLLGVAGLGIGLAVGAVVAIGHAAFARTWPSAVRSFVSGIGLLPVAGGLFGSCLGAGPRDGPVLLGVLSLCTVALAIAGIHLGERLAAELKRPLFLASRPGRVALGVASVLAIAAVVVLGR